jgi:hypothetical protein
MKKPESITEGLATSFGLAAVIQQAAGNTDKALLYNSWAIEWAEAEIKQGTHPNLAWVKGCFEVWTSNRKLWKEQRRARL